MAGSKTLGTESPINYVVSMKPYLIHLHGRTASYCQSRGSARSVQYYSRGGLTRAAILLISISLLAACITQKNPPSTPPSNTPGIGPGSCSVGQEWCQGRCLDTITFVNDSQNCGRCGNHCSFSETCTGGFCSCSPGSEMCMGRCVSSATFTSDSQNCGRCGNSCAAGESCLGGMCRKL